VLIAALNHIHIYAYHCTVTEHTVAAALHDAEQAVHYEPCIESHYVTATLLARMERYAAAVKHFLTIINLLEIEVYDNVTNTIRGHIV
jgi:hypothetical protein